MLRLSFSSFICFFFFKQKTAYEMRISDWSSDVCSSDLRRISDTEAKLQVDRRPGLDAFGWRHPEIAIARDVIDRDSAVEIAEYQPSPTAEAQLDRRAERARDIVARRCVGDPVVDRK